jgi:hypothetical protein
MTQQFFLNGFLCHSWSQFHETVLAEIYK